MAPSPELGGQPKAPDKAGVEPTTTNNNTTVSTVTSPETSSQAPSSSSSSSAASSNNPTQSSTTSGAKHSGTAGTANTTSSSSSSNNNNNSNSGSSTTTSSSQQPPQQDTSKIDNMAESDLKALLEEAITYKCPKDREHKSATFNELLSKTEMEDQEQNFPFTSRAVQSKRASGRPTQGGSLQDLPEASLHDYYYSDFPFATDYYTNLGGLGVHSSRRHHGSSSGASGGPGGGDRAVNPRQKRYTSSVSSRQREGGSLPSNVNVECPFFNDVGHHHTTGTITKFKKREGGAKSDYGTMLLTAPLTSAGAAELISAVAEVAGSTGLCGGMKNTESQLIDGCGVGVGAGHTVIDMGELESDETQHLLAHDTLQQNHMYDSGLDDLDGSGGDLYGSSTTTSGGSSTTGGAGSGCSALKKTPRFPAASYTSHAKLEIGEPSSTVRPSSVHHVDKTVSLPLLESNKNVDITPIQLGSSYQAVKCVMSGDNSKSDQAKLVMSTISANNTKFMTTQSFNQIFSQQKYTDENGNSVQQLNSGLGSSSSAAGGGSGGVGGNNSSSGAIAGGKKNRKPKSDRNTVLVIPENIAGYRGKEVDIETLVCFIENKDKQKEGKGGSGGGGSGGGNTGGTGSNPKNGTLLKVSGGSVGTGNAVGGMENGIPEDKGSKKKGEKKKEKAKLKKSNSLEELSSCSRKKQQAEEEQNTQQNHTVEQQGTVRVQEADSAVTLRSTKSSKKVQNNSSSVVSSASSASSTTSQSSKDISTTANSGKRGERRSWGTEELSYLEDSNQQALAVGVEKPEEKPSKKESKKEAKDIAEVTMPTFNLGKKRDSLRMSVESLSAVSAAGGAETAEFHVVTKKKKMKKKSQSLFAEETTSAATVGYTNTGNVTSGGINRRHLTASQSYSMGSSSARNAKYQASNSFTNDRDVYMNSLASSNDVSRRKSTSSVPPSEKSDSSDADSVQSLPIEPTRKQQQQQSHKGGQSGRGSAVVPQSYADIARIPNADKINNNLPGSGSSNSTSPLDSSSVEKWPPVQATSEVLAQALKSPSAFPELVPESSLPQPQQQPQAQPQQQQQQQQQQQNQQQYQQHQFVNSSVNSVSSNNLSNSNKATYSQSLLIAATKAEEDEFAKQRTVPAASGKLVSSGSSEHSVNSSSSISSSSSSSKLALHKSKSVDNNDYYSNEHYPALEKTVKVAKVAPAAVGPVVTNSLPEPKAVTVGKTSPVVPVVQQSQSTTSSYSTATTAIAAVPLTNSIASNALTGAKKSKKKDSLSSSTTATNCTSTVIPNEVESINNARNVAAIQTSLDAINNNTVLIENADSVTPDYTQNNGMTNRSPNGGLNLQQHPQSTPKNNNSSSSNSSTSSVSSTNVVSSKRSKKEKTTSSISASQPQYAPLSHNAATTAAAATDSAIATANSIHRPAVIIMNDNNESNPNLEFTFGFDIDQELLFGDFQEDEMSMLDHQQQQYQYHQQKPSQQQQQPLHHSSSSTENVPSPTSNTSTQSTDLGYSSMQQSSISVASPSSNSSQQHKQHHHYHNQSQQQQESYEMLNNSTDPDTYRDSIEHKFHQPPPPMVLPPAPLYTQPPPQLPPAHMLAAQQQSRQQPRPANAAAATHYNLPPPVIPGHMQQQQQQALPSTKQDSATNTPTVASAASPPTIISVPPPPLPPVVAAIPVVAAVPVVATAAIPVVVAQPATVVILPAGPPPAAVLVNTSSSNSICSSSSSAGNTSAVGHSNINTSLNNQTTANSGSNSSINSCASASHQPQEPKPQRHVQQNTSIAPVVQQPQIREKIKEINLRFIAPEQLQTNHNHDKIVNFVGMAWEDIICGANGSAKYYDGQ